MCYTEEEIEKYLEILKNYNKQTVEDENRKVRCRNCQSDSFFVESGYNICDSCGSTNCHVLGYFDLKEYDRFHFRRRVFIRESITMRKRLIKFLKVFTWLRMKIVNCTIN